MSRKVEIAPYRGDLKSPTPIVKKPGFWAALAGLLLCMVCLLPIVGGVLIAEGAATKFLEGEALLVVGAVILLGGTVATVIMFRRHKRKSNCKDEGEGQSCGV